MISASSSLPWLSVSAGPSLHHKQLDLLGILDLQACDLVGISIDRREYPAAI